MKRFLIDNQLPVSLVRWLRERGYEAEHVLEQGMAQATDERIWSRALESGAVIITKDEDFVNLSVLRSGEVSVVWLRLGNCRTSVLLAICETLWPQVLAALDSGASLVEVY